MKPMLLTFCTAALALLACAHTVAQQTDPTRPPPGLQAASAASSPETLEGLVLQSVLLGKGRKPAAVISGQLVPLGGLVAGMRLTQVTPLGVQLKGPNGQKMARSTRPELSK
jgi:MSHA biogenesis protein MshK